MDPKITKKTESAYKNYSIIAMYKKEGPVPSGHVEHVAAAGSQLNYNKNHRPKTQATAATADKVKSKSRKKGDFLLTISPEGCNQRRTCCGANALSGTHSL